MFESEIDLLRIKQWMESQHIYPRRYFFPSLNKLPYAFQKVFPISEDVSSRILCMPLYLELEIEMIESICDIISDCYGK
jgi:dTDP-4-amino-4,6-dideoxygalactose transaminase